jgi:adenosylmethionine-8-amino-7-oxononanoate aminotransferase
VGEIRGRGLMVGIELVADRATREPFPRAARDRRIGRGGRPRSGVLLYSGTGNANGVDGDTILLGPPFVVTDPELERIAAVLAESIDAAVVADAALALADAPGRPAQDQQQAERDEQRSGRR